MKAFLVGARPAGREPRRRRRRAECRREPEQESCADRQHEADEGDVAVEGDRPATWDARRNNRLEIAGDEPQDHEADRPGKKTQYRVLGDKKPHDPNAARAHRSADCELALPRLTPRQQQIRHVDAAKNENERDRSQQYVKRRRDVSDEHVVEGRDGVARHFVQRVERRVESRCHGFELRPRNLGARAFAKHGHQL